jgi:NDP-sugar pyrophosphorylase family protein
MRAIVLAGGKGTRLAPFTTNFPKPLMPVAGMPILEIVVRQLASHGFDQITFCVNHMAWLIRSYFGDGSQLGVDIGYSYETEPLGTAGPLSLVEWPAEPMLVMNADLLSSISFSDMLRFHHEERSLITIGLYPKRTKIDLGVLRTDSQNHVIEYIEKPELEHAVSMGIYIVDPRARRLLPDAGRFDFPQLVSAALSAGERVSGYRFEGHWLDIGRPGDYEQACEHFERNRGEFLPELLELTVGQAHAA